MVGTNDCWYGDDEKVDKAQSQDDGNLEREREVKLDKGRNL